MRITQIGNINSGRMQACPRCEQQATSAVSAASQIGNLGVSLLDAAVDPSPPNLSRSPSWNVTDEMTRTTAGADAAQCPRGRSRQLRLIRPRSLHEVRLHGLLPNHEFDRSLSRFYASGCLTPTWRSRRATSLTKIKLTLLSYSMQGTGPMAISA